MESNSSKSSNSIFACCLSRKEDNENSKRTIEVNKDLQNEKIQRRAAGNDNENVQDDTTSPPRKSRKQRSTTTTPLRDNEQLAGRLTTSQIDLAEGLLNKEKIEGVIDDLKTPIYTYEQWLKILKNDDLDNTSMTEVIHSLRHGVKNELRPWIWEFLTKLNALKSQHPSDYYKQLKGKTSAQDQEIKKEISQTFPDNQYFSDEAASKGEKQLFNILRAYANHDTDVGYVHGMNFIVGKLLIIMDPDNYGDSDLKYFQSFEEKFEEKIFWLFVHINSVQNWRHMYKSTQKMQVLITAFESRLKMKNPEIHSIIKDSKIDIIKCFQTTFLCLFMDSAPVPIAKRLFDLFFIEEEKVLFKVLIRAMTLCKDEISEASKQGKLEQFLKNEMLEVCAHKYRADLYVIFPEADSLD